MSRGKLVVERKAEELVAESARLLRRIPYRCNAYNHLDKSVDSVHFNIGEGAALFRSRLKRNKYDIARGEAKEVQKALRSLVLRRKLSEQDIAIADDLADQIIAMLTTMIKNLEASA
jgi:four helix bundle protein